MEIIGIHRCFSCCLHDSRSKGPRAQSPFSELQEKYFSLELANFKITARNIKAIFRENLSSRRFDLGKIYKIIIFTRGPRTTYCIKTVMLLVFFCGMSFTIEWKPDQR